MTIQRIDPGSLSRMLAILYALFGVLGGLVFGLVALSGLGSAAGVPKPGGVFSLLFGVGAILFWPICYALIGWIGGWIVAGLYNAIARRFGGVVVETQ